MPSEYTEVEKPSIEILKELGYEYVPPDDNVTAREAMNHVLLKDIFIASICRINDVDEETGRLVYNDLLRVSDNEEWTRLLRGNYSRKVAGHAKNKTVHLIDFEDTAKNTFTVTNQFKVESESSRIPDLVCFVNGIPLVVIEAKTP